MPILSPSISRRWQNIVQTTWRSRCQHFANYLRQWTKEGRIPGSESHCRIVTNQPRLSKSRFLSGSQCHLRLWHDFHAPDLADDASDVLHAVFNTGHEVGELACRRYPSGHFVAHDHRHIEEALAETRRVIEERFRSRVVRGRLRISRTVCPGGRDRAPTREVAGGWWRSSPRPGSRISSFLTSPSNFGCCVERGWTCAMPEC